MGSDKKNSGKNFIRNNKIQLQVEKLLEVEPDTSMICLGDFNGRIKTLEPNIETDENGSMLEQWVPKFYLNHLNLTEDCKGTYTFESKNGKSAIDHILTNDKLYESYRGMHIDEERAILNISDHNLVRAWFKIGPSSKPRWRKSKSKMITVMKKDEESLNQCKEALKKHIGKSTNFNLFLRKLKTSVNHTLRKRKKIKVGKKRK